MGKQGYKFFVASFQTNSQTRKGPVKIIKRVKIAHSFLVCVRSVPRYHFKLSHVIVQMAVKEFFETDF